MKTLVIYFGKKYALGAINDALATAADSVTTALGVVDRWIARAEAILGYLKSLRAKLDDGKLTTDEAAEIYAEGKALIAEVTK